MVFLSGNKLQQRQVFHHHRAVVFGLEFCQSFCCHFLLFFCQAVNAGAVLDAEVCPLSAQRSRVDGIEIFLQNVGQCGFVCVKDNFHRFGVTAVVADFFVSDSVPYFLFHALLLAQSVTHTGGEHAGHHFHIFFCSPEAAACQVNGFFLHITPHFLISRSSYKSTRRWRSRGNWSRMASSR